jgi:O-antigen ligase
MGSVVLRQAVHVPISPVSAGLFLVLAIFAAAATRRRSAYGLVLLIVSDPFDYPRYIGWTTMTIPKAVLIGVALGLLLRRVSLAPLRRRELRPLLGGAIAIALVTIATAIPSTYIDAVGRESLKALEYLATFALAVVAFADDPDEAPAWYALAAVTAVVSASALVQEVTVAPAGMMLFGHVVPRIAGLLEGPNQLAGFIDIVAPLLLARGIARGGAPFMAVLGVAIVTDVLTFSRGGLFALVIGLFCVALRTSNPRAQRALAIGGGLVFAAIAAVLVKLHLFARFLSVSDVDTASGLGSRGALWSAAFGFWRAHPILGIGAGNFELELPDAGLAGVRTHANSLYLQSLAEGGILLFGATVFTYGAAIRACYVRAPKAALFAGIGAATIALAAHQLVDFLTFFPKIGVLWWLWLGIASGALVTRSDVRT